MRYTVLRAKPPTMMRAYSNSVVSPQCVASLTKVHSSNELKEPDSAMSSMEPRRLLLPPKERIECNAGVAQQLGPLISNLAKVYLTPEVFSLDPPSTAPMDENSCLNPSMAVYPVWILTGACLFHVLHTLVQERVGVSLEQAITNKLQLNAKKYPAALCKVRT